MDARTAVPVRGQRLNPFPFPSDTTLRFALLATFVICGSAALHGNMHDISEAATLECSSGIWSSASGADLAKGDSDELTKMAALIARCVEYLRPSTLWKVAGVLLAVSVAALVYRAGPGWIVRSRKLEPIATANSPELEAELMGLVATAGLDRTPEFLWNPLAAGLPIVFGRGGRFRISLSGAFVSQTFLGDRARFRAVVLHELAHIRTGDIPKTYTSIALLAAFFTTALVPAIVVTAGRLAAAQWAGAFHMLLQCLFWSVVSVLAGLSVLRAREYYADVQASVWQRGSDLAQMLAALPRPTGAPWRRFLAFHPDPAERLRIIGDPSRLFRLGFADAFGIGVAAWSIIDVATFVIIPLVPLHGMTGLYVFMGLRTILTVATLFVAIGAIGIGVWRGAFARLMHGRSPYLGAASMGLALVAGSLPRRTLVAADAFRMNRDIRAPLYPTMVLNTAVDIVLLVGCVMIFRWIAGNASAWFEVVVRSRSPRPVLMASVSAALLMVLGTLGSASFAVYFYFLSLHAVPDAAQFAYLSAFVVGVPVFAATVIAWAFPFAATFWSRRNRSDRPAPWLFLDHHRSEIPLQAPLSIPHAAVTGLTFGLLFWLPLELVFFRGYLPGAMGDAIATSFDAYVTWISGLAGNAGALIPGTAAVAQVLAAAVASVKAVRLSVVHGLCAVSCCGVVITAGNILFFGMAPPVDLYGIAVTGLVLLGLGGALGLVSAIVAAEVGTLARRVLPDFHVRGHRMFRIGALALLAAVVLGLMIVRVSGHVMAMRELRTVQVAAEAGNSVAQARLGMMYASGTSVVQNDVTALLWWTKAADQGNPDAKFALGQASFKTGDAASAFRLFSSAAIDGHVEAELSIGFMYAQGLGVMQDDVQALGWFKKAAEHGNAEAQNNLAMFLATGRGGPRDDALAIQWFRMSAENGHAQAQANLGHIYRSGKSVPQDKALAWFWFRKAADNGLADAQFNIGAMYETGDGVEKDDSKAADWLRRAADQGHVSAADYLEAMCARQVVAACPH